MNTNPPRGGNPPSNHGRLGVRHARGPNLDRGPTGRPRASFAVALVAAVALALAPGCQRRTSSQPPSYGSGYPPQGQGGYPPPQGYPQQGYPQQGYPPPQGYPQQPAPGPTGQAPAPAPSASSPFPGLPGLPGLPQLPGLPNVGGALDPINNVDMNWLRNQAGSVMGELIAALPPGPRSRVEGIPFIADPTPGEVNAFAACDDQGKPLMAITDGLLEIEAYMAQFRATDEIFGTKKLDQYTQLVAQNQKPGQPIVKPAPGMVDPGQHIDARKVARQHQLFDEQVAFVLGHELGHHHLGHLGCTAPNGTAATAANLGHLLSRAMPAFNQGNEVAADIAGTNNTLDAGKRRGQAYHLTEGGALLTLNFFSALDVLTPATIVFNFERSHPPPQIRKPIVQQAANTWRVTGGAWPFPSLPF